MSCWKDGDPAAPLLIVAMAPGSEELAQDTPLVGPAGRLLWSMLKHAGIDRADTYILNIIGEWPEGPDGGPTPAQLDTWWDRFDGAVGDFTGRTALLLGGDAFHRFTGLGGGIQGWGGYLLDSGERLPVQRARRVTTYYKTNTKLHKKGDPKVAIVKESAPPPPFKGLCLPALHPAGVLRTGLATAPILAGQCQRAARAIRGELRPARSTYVTYPVLYGRQDEVAVDIETGGITNAITRIGIATRLDAFSTAWSSSSRGVTKAILSQPDTTYILHNAGFDSPRLALADAPICGPIRDTMLAAAMLQPDLPKGLNAAASLYLDVPRWKHLDEEDPAKYNALDAIRTFELWQVEKQLLDRTGQRTLFDSTIMSALPVLINMGSRGIALSTSRREAWLASLREEGTKAAAEWNAQTNGCNFSSPYQLKALFSSLGIAIPFNKDGAETTDKQGLARIAAEHPSYKPLIGLLGRVRGIYKDIKTYAEVAVGADGRVHPSFTPAYKDEDGLGKGLAGTWRITAKEPNLQNQPTRARLMYVPSAGMCFIGADYSQLEARILAWLAGDEVLLADCDGNIHTRNAERLKVDKTRAKNGFYGWSYLAGGRTLQNTFAGQGFKVSLRECEDLLAGFDSTYKKAAAFRQRALAEMQAQRYMQNAFGLRRYFPHQKFPAPSAMSTLIQSTGAIMMWRILPQLEAMFASLGGRLLLTVHDDVLGELPPANRLAGLAALKDIMEQTFSEIAPTFRVPVSLKTSDLSWGEMQDVTL